MEEFKKTSPIELLLGFIFKDDNKSEELSQMEFLKKTPFFEGMSKRQLKKVIQVLHTRIFREGDFLFQYGHPGAALFFIQSGEVSIEIPKAKSTQVVTTLGENTFLGEIALLNKQERTASAKALKKTKCLALYRNDLMKLQKTEPEITSLFYQRLAEVVGKRLVRTTQLLGQAQKEIQSSEEETENAA